MSALSQHAKAARRRGVARGGAFAVLLAGGLTFADVTFRHIAFDTPLDVTPGPEEPLTDAVRRFQETGKNPYVDDPEAVAEGKRLFAQWCASCHGVAGTGGMGPSLVSGDPVYPRTETDVGLFEAAYGGALGAMQSFKGRLSQDQILKIIAHVQELRKNR